MVSTRVLRDDGIREETLAPHCEGPFAVLKRVSDLAHVVDFPPSMPVHRTVNMGFLPKCEVSERYQRLLPSVDEAAPSRGLAKRHRPKCRSRRLDEADMHPYSISNVESGRSATGHQSVSFSSNGKIPSWGKHGRTMARCVVC
ncbi:hypothetical protein CSUI_008557 [Cystoisospora suis]|uniref:Uncharacterized protein n=1 Tax=Cystoisospora suis TaxID=483139 RepID=A0A2C6JMP4_9APIC|nr:hypothetical protein CSUI_008557 [Cystoisospora suis]